MRMFLIYVKALIMLECVLLNIKSFFILVSRLWFPFVAVVIAKGVEDEFGVGYYPDYFMDGLPLKIFSMLMGFIILKAMHVTILLLDDAVTASFKSMGYTISNILLSITSTIFIYIGLVGLYETGMTILVERPIMLSFGIFGVYLLLDYIRMQKTLGSKEAL